MRRLLRAYMSRRQAKNLIEVIEERASEDVVIYWFHWPYDGPIRRDDYEPVAVIRGGVKLAARPHYRLVWTDDVYMRGGLPTVVFLTDWHSPTIKAHLVGLYLRFLGRLLVEVDYSPRRGDVPTWFRRAGLKTDFRDYAIKVSHDPLNMGFGYDLLELPDFRALAAEVDEAIRILDSGDLAKCIERCRRIVAEVRRSRAFGEISELVEPFVRYVDEHGLPSRDEEKKAFTEDLREHLGYLGIVLRGLSGEDVEV